MKISTYILILAATIITLTSCDGVTFLSASSAVNEVMVIMDKEAWEDDAGRALFGVLNSPAKGLPQIEPNFRIIHITPENFTSTFKMARNIVIPEISDIYTETKVSSETNKYAYGQIVMTVKSPDTTSFVEYMDTNREMLVEYILNKEMERTADWLIKESGTPQTRIQQLFGINIYYPKGLPNISEHPDFYWATNNAPRNRKDIVIYQFPYTSETIFEKDSLIAKRNEILGKYITGSFDSHITTAVKAYDPDYRKMDVDGLFRAEIRGLWEMTTDMMGGPFVAQAFVNENTNMVVVAEVFVFAPEKDKRNLMRSMEAALYTIAIKE